MPADGIYGGYYCQAINAAPPHPWAARLWQEFIYSDQGQLIWLKGFTHPARFQDLAKRKVIPASLLKALPAGRRRTRRSSSRASGSRLKAQATIKAQWAAKVG